MNALVVIKIVVLVFIVVTGWAVLGGTTKDRIPHPEANFHNAFAGTSGSGYEWAIALFKCLDSYAGWSNAAYVLNEVRNPVRTLKIAGPVGLGVCGVLYMLANVAYFAAATPQEVIQSKQTVAALFMSKVFGTAGEKAISVLIALSAFGNVMTVSSRRPIPCGTSLRIVTTAPDMCWLYADVESGYFRPSSRESGVGQRRRDSVPEVLGLELAEGSAWRWSAAPLDSK